MSIRFRVLPVVVILLLPSLARAEPPVDWAKRNMPQLVELYRHLHAHPELSLQEAETAARLADALKTLGAEVTTGVGGHGVVGRIANGEGPTLMLRTDLDALPIVEQTGLPFASTVTAKDRSGREVGVMHACGHDLHVVNLVGTGRYLAEHKDRWQGTLLLVGEPAEEIGAGAKAMLDDGLFDRFGKPDYGIMLHVDPALRAGAVGFRAGFTMANVDSVDITINGRGGHGAYPHATVDPIVQAAQLVMALQTIVGREVKPIEPAVVTVGSIHGGTKHNVIGNTCHLQLTVRSYDADVRRQIHEAIRRKAAAVAQGAGAPEPTVHISEGTPAVWNDVEMADRLGRVFAHVVGQQNVEKSEPSMGGEDFGRFGRAGVAILAYRLGSVDAERLEEYEKAGREPPSLHSPVYYPDVEPTLATGIGTMAEAAIELLPKPE